MHLYMYSTEIILVCIYTYIHTYVHKEVHFSCVVFVYLLACVYARCIAIIYYVRPCVDRYVRTSVEKENVHSIITLCIRTTLCSDAYYALL